MEYVFFSGMNANARKMSMLLPLFRGLEGHEPCGGEGGFICNGDRGTVCSSKGDGIAGKDLRRGWVPGLCVVDKLSSVRLAALSEPSEPPAGDGAINGVGYGPEEGCECLRPPASQNGTCGWCRGTETFATPMPALRSDWTDGGRHRELELRDRVIAREANI